MALPKRLVLQKYIKTLGKFHKFFFFFFFLEILKIKKEVFRAKVLKMEGFHGRRPVSYTHLDVYKRQEHSLLLNKVRY